MKPMRGNNSPASHTIFRDHGRTENRLAADDFIDPLPAGYIQHVIRPGHRAEMEETSRDYRRRDVIAVGFAATGMPLPIH